MNARFITASVLAAAITAGATATPALADGAASTRNILIGGAAAAIGIVNWNRKKRQKQEEQREQARRQAQYRSYFYTKYGYYPNNDQFRDWYFRTYGVNRRSSGRLGIRRGFRRLIPPESRSPASGSFYAARRTAPEAAGAVRRRWAVAIAFSIALNEIAIGFLRAPGPAPEPPQVRPVRIVLERHAPTPRPTVPPTPRPTPTPPPVVRVPPRATPAPVPRIAAAKAAGLRAPVHGGAAAKPIHHFKNFDVYQQLFKSRLGRAAGVSGSGAGTGVGPATGGGANGTGAGNGKAGSGSGTVNANTPCGEVIFNVRGAPDYHNGAATERITATVQFPDGHTETDTFPYTWTYENGERDDPWSASNISKKDLDITLVFPPAGSDTSAYPPLIKYILDHTRPNGTTVLEPCPGALPLPAH